MPICVERHWYNIYRIWHPQNELNISHRVSKTQGQESTGGGINIGAGNGTRTRTFQLGRLIALSNLHMPAKDLFVSYDDLTYYKWFVRFQTI